MKWVVMWLALLMWGCDGDQSNVGSALPAVIEAPPTETARATAAIPWWLTVAPYGTLAAPRVTRTPQPQPTTTATPDIESYPQGILFRTTREKGFEAVWIMDEDGSNQRKLRLPGDDFFGRKAEQFYLDSLAKQLQSPDGTQRLYVNPELQLSLQSVQSGYTRRLTFFGAGIAYEPAWSPWGDQVACVSNDTSLDEIWLVPADPNLWGDDAHKRPLTHSQWESNKHPTWSPEGSRIAFWSNREGRRQIYVMNRDGSGVRGLSRNAFEDYDPVWIR